MSEQFSLLGFEHDPVGMLARIIEVHFQHNGKTPAEIRLTAYEWTMTWRGLPDSARFQCSEIRILGVLISPDREVTHGTLRVIGKNDSVDVWTLPGF